ncbi:MAG: ABC transporter ATP-binding protein [Oceanipulchritudo sp.]
MPEGPSIVLDEISKRFADGPLVLDRVSISAGPGEVIAVVGPSGCGKTTLLRVIAGLIKPSSGGIRHGEREIETAYIFQDATLLPWCNVRENIALPLRLKGIGRPQRDQVAAAWASRVKLEGAMDYFPRQLSGGMKMRASIARALSLDPGVLLLDEPFGALDAITRNALNEEFIRLHDQSHWTAFFVTHSVTEAVFLSHRIVILGNAPGRVRAVVENPLAHPREAHMRESIEFQHLAAETTARLQEVLSS